MIASTADDEYHNLSYDASRHDSVTISSTDDSRHTLPVEVIERIFKYLAWDSGDMYWSIDRKFSPRMAQETMLSCALVCRSLYTISRLALFSSLTFGYSGQINRLADLIRRNPRMRQWLDNTQIVIVNVYILNTFAVQFAGYLPNCTTLVVTTRQDSVRRTNTLPSIRPLALASLSSFRSVTTLYLEDSDFKCFSNVQSLMRIFPNLSNFAWCACTCWHLPRLIPSVDRWTERPRLVSFVISTHDEPTNNYLYSWISRISSTTSTLQSVWLSSPHDDEEQLIIEGLVEALGPSLTELRFGSYDELDDYSLQSQLRRYTLILSKLCPLIRLRTLMLTLSMRDKALPFFDDDLGDASDWIPLDQLLGKDPFSRLETVKINFFGGEEWKKCDLGADFVDYFQERLPMLYGRRILRSRYDWEDDWVEALR